MGNNRYSKYLIQLDVCLQQVKIYLNNINKLEKLQMPENEKLLELEIIMNEIKNINIEIDRIKEEIRLLPNLTIN